MNDMKKIESRISEIAINGCKGYPEIENQTAFGALWAIEQTLEGVKLANNDLHIMIANQKDEISKLKAKNNVLDQKLRKCRLKIQSARSLLNGAFYFHDMDYDIQGVNQAHRVLDGGQPPKKTKLEE